MRSKLIAVLFLSLFVDVAAFADLGTDIATGPLVAVSGCPSACQAAITWTTNHAGNSWVYLSYASDPTSPTARFGQEDSVTSHTVTITNLLVPYNFRPSSRGVSEFGNYGYYIATKRTSDGSWSSKFGPTTNAYTGNTLFHTTPLVETGATTVKVTPWGQKHVYPGHDLYFIPAIQLLSGGTGTNTGNTLVLVSYSVTKSSVDTGWTQPVRLLGRGDALSSGVQTFNPAPGWDGEINTLSSGTNAGKDFATAPADATSVSLAMQMNGNGGLMRIRVPSGAAQGTDYNAHVLLRMYNGFDGATGQVGGDIVFDWPFTVYPTAAFTATPPSSFPTIPHLSDWTTLMISPTNGGDFWCDGFTNGGFFAESVEYGTFRGPPYAIEGDLTANGSPSIWKAFNYDGGRVYTQIADYRFALNSNTTERDHWKHCAQGIFNPFDNYVNRALGSQYTEPNQFMTGSAMYYNRTHDANALAALQHSTDTFGKHPGAYGLLDTRGMRVGAYTWASQTANELSGHSPWVLSKYATDIALANLDTFQQTTGHEFPPLWGYHPFVMGALFESMIEQYELDTEKSRTPDPAIPLEIGKSIYFWHNGRTGDDTLYNSDIATLRYNGADVPMSHMFNAASSTDVWAQNDALFVPAEAWYWSKTGDATVLAWGDSEFSAIWSDTTNLASGPKEFNQTFKWTFDFVRYRSGAIPKATFLPSQNTYEGAPWADTTPPLIFNEQNCGLSGALSGALCQSISLATPLVAGNSVTLQWDTTENATSEIYYTTSAAPTCTYSGGYVASVAACTGGYSGHFATDSGGVRHHNMLVSGLAPNTLHHYRIYSQDLSGNGVVVNDANFTTGISALPQRVNGGQVNSGWIH